MSAKLDGKVAVVTGASKGIGAAIARHLAKAGASVVVNYSSSREGGEKVVADIEKDGGKAIAVGADMAKKEEIDRLFREAKAKFGRVDILVNNAGIYGFAPLAEITEEHFHKHFNLNVLGLILASQKAAEYFGPEGGSIINISSLVSTSPAPTGTVYSATKAAVDAVTRSLARELGPKKIRVNAISPGPVATEGTAGFEALFDQMVGQTPLGRLGRPDDIAKIAVFLASDDSGWLSGEALLAAGGLSST